MRTERARRVLVPATAALLGVAVLGTVFAGEPALFSHKQHLEQGADCAACHDTTAPAGPPTLKKEGCRDCHDAGAPAYRRQPKASRLSIQFPHKAHADAVKCGECHRAVAADLVVDGAPIMAQTRCVSCHQELGVAVPAGDCAACHGGDMRKTRPRDHDQAWLTRHGREAQWRVFDDHGRDCKLCHRADACLTCHRETRPRDHNGLWRVRLHGTSASWDRQRCKTCHETGECIACHRSTPPLNHTAAWRMRHGPAAKGSTGTCWICHQPSECVSCHGAAR